MKKKIDIILATKSPRRVELFSELGYDFQIAASNFDEESFIEPNPVKRVKKLSYYKAKSIAQNFYSKSKIKIVIGSDTIVVKDNIILEKPKSKKQAREFLNWLKNSNHFVYTAVSIILINGENKKTKTFVEKSVVSFGDIDKKSLDLYLKTNDCMDKAGAYGIQGFARQFVKKLNGDHSNVMGLPLYRVKKELKNIIDEL